MGKTADNLVQLATIGTAHGLKGEVKVQSFTADPLDFTKYGALFDKNGHCFEIEHMFTNKNSLIVHFSGIDNRNNAEALNGTALYINRHQLPDDLEEDEFYQTDLVGLDVKDEHGEVLGKVNALFNFGGGDLLELLIEGHKLVLIPFSKAAVPEIDIKKGFIAVHSVASGLITETEKSEEEEG